MNEAFSILIDSRSRFETGEAGGVWLDMPATKEQLQDAMKSVGITADNPQDFFINGFANTEDCPFDVPLAVIQSGSMDELNYLGKLLEMQSNEDSAKFAAAVTHGERAGSLKDLINLAQNLDCYWLYPTVQSEEDYGYYLIDELDELELPAEAKPYFKYEEYGRDAAINDGGRFTDQGYIYNNKNTFTEWYNGREGEIPKEYRIMSYPQPESPAVDRDAIGTRQAEVLTAEPPQPRPIVPIVLTADKPAEKIKEITDKLEQGIQAVFNSEQYAAYLNAMSKFHNYSFNNTILIAMQGGNLVKGYRQWEKEFDRHVKQGEKGIKILAPAPFKIKQQVEKIDPNTQKPVIGGDGKPLTEEQEIVIPAYKVVTVFDVSQTEGKELPDIAAPNLVADVEQYGDFWEALEKASPFAIGFDALDEDTKGTCNYEERHILLNQDMSQLQNLKTAIHEIAHATLHDIDKNTPKDGLANRPDRHTREVQAESVAYTVCQHFGLDTSEYSFAYIAGWSNGKEMTELKSSLETIQSAARDLITEIEGHFTDLQQQRDTEQSRVFDKQAFPEEAQQQAQDKDAFTIYQLKRGDETRDYRFEPYERLQAVGKAVDPANYDLIYTAPLAPDMTLESIFERFNLDRPADFKGHSLSVSDVVVLHQSGQNTAHYVDSIGYRQVPEFLQQREAERGSVFEQLSQQDKAYIPDGYMTGETIETPRGRFSITAMSREEIEAAGYGFHHQSEDGKHLIMGNGARAFAVLAQQPENHLKHIEDTVEQNDNSFDGIINNTPQTPTVSDLEAKAKAGEAISLVDLANAVKNEKREKPQKKPSILKQLDEYKKQAKTQPKKQQQKELKNDLEV